MTRAASADVARAAELFRVLEGESDGAIATLVLLLGPVRSSGSVRAPSAGAVRQRRWRASRERLAGVSRDGLETLGDAVSPTPPSDQNGELQGELSIGKAPEVQKNPEIQKDLPVTAGAREGDDEASRETRNVSRRSRHYGQRAGSIDPPADWEPNDGHRAKAEAFQLELTREVERFRIYPNRRRPVKDWDRAFSWWLENAMRFGQARSPGGLARPNGHAAPPGRGIFQRAGL